MVDSTTGGLLAAQGAGLLLALLVAWKTLHAHRVAQARALGLFGVGFLALAGSQAAAALLEYTVATVPVEIPRDALDKFDLLFWAYYGFLLTGLVLVFLSFGRHPFQWAPALAGLLLWAGVVLELAVLVAFFFVVLHAGLNHIARKGPGSLVASLGFFLLMVGHFLFLYEYAPLQPRGLTGELVHTAGFLLLFLAVNHPRRLR